MTEIQKKGKALIDAMAAFIGITPKAELTLQDSNGTEILFPDLESGSTPKVGDNATVDGAAVPDGSYIMPSLEEVTAVFVGGAITEIIPKKEEEEETEEAKAARLEKEEADKLEAQSKLDAKAEEIMEVSVWSVNVENTSFAVGDVVQYKYDDEVYNVSAGEFKLKDGRSIVTDASGTIVNIQEGEEITEDIVAEANFEDLLKKVTEKVTEEVKAKLDIGHKAQLEEKQAEIIALNKKIESKDINAQARNFESDNQKNRPKGSFLHTRKKSTN